MTLLPDKEEQELPFGTKYVMESGRSSVYQVADKLLDAGFQDCSPIRRASVL